MKLRRPTLVRTAGAAVGAAALAGGLAVAAAPAHASPVFVSPQVEVCDYLSGNVAIDLWHGSSFVLKTPPGQCKVVTLLGFSPSDAFQLFLDGQGVEINQLFFENDDPVVVDVTGSASDVHQGITIN